MLTLKTESLEWPAVQETLLNLCGFLANNEKVEESINLYKQAINAYKQVHSSGVKGLTEEFAKVLEREGKLEQASEVRNIIGSIPKLRHTEKCFDCRTEKTVVRETASAEFMENLLIQSSCFGHRNSNAQPVLQNFSFPSICSPESKQVLCAFQLSHIVRRATTAVSQLL